MDIDLSQNYLDSISNQSCYGLKILEKKDENDVNWKFFFGILEISEYKSEIVKEYNYNTWKYTETYFKIENNKKFFQNFKKNIKNIKESIEINQIERKKIYSYEKYPFKNNEWPFFFLDCKTNENQKYSYQNEDILYSSRDSPCFPNLHTLFHVLFNVEVNYHYDNVANHFWIKLNDYRCKIDLLEIKGNEVIFNFKTALKNCYFYFKYYLSNKENLHYNNKSQIINPEEKRKFQISFKNPEEIFGILVIDTEIIDKILINKSKTSIRGRTVNIINRRDSQELEQILNQGENERMEFKFSLSKSDESKYDFLESVCSMLNTGGGLIIIGIHDKTKELHNITEVKSVKKRIFGWIHKYLNPQFSFDVFDDNYSGKTIIFVEIPKGDDPPYFVTKNDEEIAYKRSFEHDFRMKKNDFDSIYHKKYSKRLKTIN